MNKERILYKSPEQSVTKERELLTPFERTIITWPQPLLDNIAAAASKRGLRADLI
jgi:hypothetical protein